MKIIDLKQYYPLVYTKPAFVEVSDEVAEVLEEAWHIEHRQENRKTYHKVLSLDASVGLENYVLFHALSPEEYLLMAEEDADQEAVLGRLREAMKQLTPAQVRRLHARFTLGLKMREIAALDGVSVSNASESVRAGIKRLRKIFLKNKWMNVPGEAVATDDSREGK